MSPLSDAVLISILVMLDRPGHAIDLLGDPERQEKVRALPTMLR